MNTKAMTRLAMLLLILLSHIVLLRLLMETQTLPIEWELLRPQVLALLASSAIACLALSHPISDFVELLGIFDRDKKALHALGLLDTLNAEQATEVLHLVIKVRDLPFARLYPEKQSQAACSDGSQVNQPPPMKKALMGGQTIARATVLAALMRRAGYSEPYSQILDLNDKIYKDADLIMTWVNGADSAVQPDSVQVEPELPV